MKPGSQIPPPPILYRMMQLVMGPILRMAGLCCRSAFDLSSEQMDRKLTRDESLRLRLHLMMCGLCRRLPSQFAEMRKLMIDSAKDENEVECCSESLSEEAKSRLRRKLNDQGKA